MMMAGGIMALAGAAMHIGGTSLEAREADKKRAELKDAENKWLPDIPGYTRDYYKDLFDYSDDARKVSMAEQDTMMALRERALPGIGEIQRQQVKDYGALARGELPQGVLDAANRGGAAGGVGGGLGMSPLLQFLSRGQGSYGVMQMGAGLLGALLGQSAMPNTNWLSQILTPTQRTQNQMNIRSQNIGIEGALAGMNTGNEVWAGSLKSAGATLIGSGMSMMGGGGGSSGMSGLQSNNSGGAFGGSNGWSARGGTMGPGADGGASSGGMWSTPSMWGK